MEVLHDALKARLLELENGFHEFGVGPILNRIQDASRGAPTKVVQDRTFHIDGSQITFPYALHIGIRKDTCGPALEAVLSGRPILQGRALPSWSRALAQELLCCRLLHGRRSFKS